MSVNNSNTHPDYDPNIKIKSEPNTEPAAPTPPVNPAILNAVIKTEPGLPTASSTVRLPSFRPPRDYTLGGLNTANIKLEKPKKVFTPNLNVQRNKNREEANDSKKNEPGKPGRGDRDKRKHDRNKDKGKGRGKAANNLVQSTGIFSEGLADIAMKRHSGGGYRDRDSYGSSRETRATLERPKLSIPQKVNKVEEEEKLRDLRRDDFIDDDDMDVDMENVPVALPMIHESKVKTEPSHKVSLANKTDGVPLHLQNGNASHSQIGSSVTDTRVQEVKLPLTVPQVMENKTNNFIMIQLPDCLPGMQAEDDLKTKRPAEPSPETEADKANKFCTLNNLKEGMLGKLQILRSGKARLVLGTNNLIVDVGSNISFRQDLIAAEISEDKQSGDLINLGTVSSTLICSPDWESMLKAL